MTAGQGGGSGRTADRRRGPSSARALPCVGTALLLVSLWLSWSWPGARTVVVLGDLVPRYWHAVTAVVVAGLVVLGVAAARRDPGDDAPGPGRAVRRRVARLATAALVVVAVAGCGLVTVLDTTTDVHVLSPPSAAGCRVVARETSFLLIGNGALHVLPAGAVVAEPVSWYSADDGYTPVGHGTVHLEWEGETAHVRLWGEPDRPADHQAVLACDGPR